MDEIEDEELLELLRRADRSLDLGDGEEPDFEVTIEDEAEDVPFYRNYSNGYGSQIQQHDSNGYTGQPNQPIRAYNADFPRADHLAQVLEEDAPTPPERPIRLEKPPTADPPAREEKPKKKRGKWWLPLVAVLAVLLLLPVAAWFFVARQPKTDAPLGARKPGAATVLLCGADIGGYRTDTMMLLYMDSVKGEAGLLSLPRDTYTITAYGAQEKLNSAYGRNGCGVEGMDILLHYVEDIIGYRPDGYALIELPVLGQLVDMMGGVDFNVPTEMGFHDWLDADLAPGMQHLNGNDAIAVVRFRYGYVNQDLGRVDTQKAFLKACMQQWAKPSNLKKLPEVKALMEKECLTNLTMENCVWLAGTLLRCGFSDLRTDTLPGYATYIGDQSFYVLDEAGVLELVNAHYNPYKQEITDVNIAGEG